MTNGVRESLEHAVTRRSSAAPINGLRNIASLQSQQIHEQPIRTGHTRRKLPEETQSRVDIGPASERRDQQATLQLHRRTGRSGVVSLEYGHVGRVPAMRKVQPTLLNPTAPVALANGVRIMKDGMGRIELGDRRVLVRYAIVGTGDGQRIRRESAVHERILLV